MRRADRLFEIVQHLRGDRLVTAPDARRQARGVGRTIYRDVRDLQTAGVPIDGEAGVGYLLRPGFQLPPLMFTLAEIEALVVGARMVEAWAGRPLAGAAAEALVKIAAVVPPDEMRAAGRVAIYAPGMKFDERCAPRFDLFARGIEERRKTFFAYRDANNGDSERTVRPLRCTSGAAPGRSPPGASFASTSAPSASTAPSASRSAKSASSRKPARGSTTTSPASRGRRSYSSLSSSRPFIDFSLAKTASASSSACFSALGAGRLAAAASAAAAVVVCAAGSSVSPTGCRLAMRRGLRRLLDLEVEVDLRAEAERHRVHRLQVGGVPVLAARGSPRSSAWSCRRGA